MEPQQERRANRDYDSEPKEEATVIVHHNAEFREVKENRTAHRAEREQGTDAHGGRNEQKHAGDKFDYPGTVAAPWLLSDRGEYVDGFIGAGEFEEERLQQNYRGHYPGDPTCD